MSERAKNTAFEIIDDCAHASDMKKAEVEIQRAIDAAVAEALEKVYVIEWHPVSESVPEELQSSVSGRVPLLLLFMRYGQQEIEMGWRSYGEFRIQNSAHAQHPTHWAKMRSKPKPV